MEMIYITNPTEIFYLTGQKLSKGKLFLYGNEKQLFVDGRYLEQAKGAEFDSDENIQKFLSGRAFDVVIFDPEVPYSQYLQMQKMFSGKKLEAKNTLQERRMIKTEDEIRKMQKSADLNWAGLEHIRGLLREGVMEREVAWEFEKYCREKGASKMAFEPIVAFGPNTSMPHYRAGGRKLGKGDAVTIDVGIVLDEYSSDLTRSFYFGKPPEEYLKMEKLVRQAHGHAVSMCKPRVELAMLDQEVRRIFREQGREAEYKHSLGHSLGLEVHEYPVISIRASGALRERMVITIEPGLYVDGKWGYRHEDTVVITKDGCRNFYELF